MTDSVEAGRPLREVVETIVPDEGAFQASFPSARSVLLAALAVVIHRHAGHRDLTLEVATPDGSRFVDLTIDPEQPFSTLCAAITVPPAGGAALLRVVLPQDVVLGAGQLEDGVASPPWDFRVAVQDDGSLAASLAHATTGISRAWPRRLLTHYATLLADALGSASRPVGALRMDVGSQQSAAWALAPPASHRPPPAAAPDESLVTRFRAVAKDNGQFVAVVDPSAALTYAALDEITDANARRLRHLVDDDARIGLLHLHNAESIVGIWSVLKAGAAYVPLDHRHPDGRLREILLDADVAALLCAPCLEERGAQLVPEGVPTISVAERDHTMTDEPPLRPGPAADDLAYLLHTSGSTGRPKAVMQSHRNVLAHALTYARRVGMGTGDQVPMFSRYTFDGASDLSGV